MFGPPHKGAGVLVAKETVGAKVTMPAVGSLGVGVQSGGRVCGATGSAGPSGLDANTRYLLNTVYPAALANTKAINERTARIVFCAFVILFQ